MRADSNERIHFDCGQCGDCCSSWNIPIEGEKARTLLQKPWVHERLAQVNRSLVFMANDLYRIPLTDENVCIFLSDDRRCLVQAHEGVALKPLECRRFPFAAIKAPKSVVASGLPDRETTYYETSAACKKISETLLLAFRPIIPKPLDYQTSSLQGKGTEIHEKEMSAPNSLSHLDYDETFDVLDTLPRRVPVGPFLKKATWEAYEGWCDYLRTLFTDPACSPEAALKSAARALNQISSLKMTAFSSETRIANSGFPSRVSHWLLIFLLRKPYRTWSWVQLLRQGRYDDPRLFGIPVDLQASTTEKVVMPFPVEQDRLLKAFLFNLLCRRLPLTRGISMTSWLAVATCACLLVRWYASMLSWLRHDGETGESEPKTDGIPEPGDVSLAIRLVERYYTGHQPRFLYGFYTPWKGILINALLLR